MGLKYIFLNENLQDDIINKQFTSICKLLRSGQIEKIDRATFNLLADHLEGKIPRQRGPKFSKERQQRNENAWQLHRQLMQQDHLTYEEAIAEMARIEADLRDEGKEPTEYEGRIRSYLQELAKREKQLEQYRKEDEAMNDHLLDLCELYDLSADK